MVLRAVPYSGDELQLAVHDLPQADAVWVKLPSCRAFTCHNMEDCYGAWGNLLPGLLEGKVPAHMWLRAVTGEDQDMWQYLAKNPAQEEQVSQAMTNWDNMVRPSLRSRPLWAVEVLSTAI